VLANQAKRDEFAVGISDAVVDCARDYDSPQAANAHAPLSGVLRQADDQLMPVEQSEPPTLLDGVTQQRALDVPRQVERGTRRICHRDVLDVHGAALREVTAPVHDDPFELDPSAARHGDLGQRGVESHAL
jgi:hypothetical protein